MPVINYQIKGAWKEVGIRKIPQKSVRILKRGDTQYEMDFVRDVSVREEKMVTDAAWIQGTELTTWDRGSMAASDSFRLVGIDIQMSVEGVATCVKQFLSESSDWEATDKRKVKI